MFETFKTWAELLDHIRNGEPVYYHAPMDYRPVRVAAYIRRGGKIRVIPPTSDADPFMADRSHLDRFKRRSDV